MRYSTLLIAIGMSLVIYYTLKKWTGLPNVESEKSKWYFRIMPIALLGIALYLSVRCMDMPYIAMWKRICILGILWGIAYVDQKENIIPNQYLLLCLGLRGIIFLIEILQNPMDAAAQMIAELIGCGVLLAFSLLIRILSRKGTWYGGCKVIFHTPFIFRCTWWDESGDLFNADHICAGSFLPDYEKKREKGCSPFCSGNSRWYMDHSDIVRSVGGKKL